MAGEWLKMECATPDKPEVLALTVRMGWDDPDLTVGKLFRLWRWFDQQTVDGNAHGVTAALLDRQVGVSGFIQAVADVGWLVITSDGICLSNFEKHNGATAKSRAQTAKRVANHKGNATGNGKGNAPTVSEALPREEKRREELNTPTSVGVARTQPGEACKAMRDVGLGGVSPSHPKLIALLDAGISVDELRDAAKDAADRGKPFAYALATAEGRRRDSATATLPNARASPETAFQKATRERAEQFSPGIARRDPTKTNEFEVLSVPSIASH